MRQRKKALSTGPVHERLEGIRAMMLAAHGSGVPLSNESKGNEREVFVRDFLLTAFAPGVRFGSGDITDIYGRRTGQLDTVVENPFLFSLPITPASSRLYMAEAVAAVVEVKSNVASQWSQVRKTSDKVKTLQGRYLADDQLESASTWEVLATTGEASQQMRDLMLRKAQAERTEAFRMARPRPSIPVIAVGFKGWANPAKAQATLEDSSVDAVLIIESSIFLKRSKVFGHEMFAQGPSALLAFLDLISQLVAQATTQVSLLHNYRIPPALRLRARERAASSSDEPPGQP